MTQPLSKDFCNWLVDLRREFHTIPEPKYQEKKTALKIGNVLQGLNVPYQDGIGQTGIVARLKSRQDGPLQAFRADIDALPIEEANDVPYRSQHPGYMHACGHDGHITIGLGIIRNLIEQKWSETGKGEILFIFQPAEEGGAGAKAMLDSGIFDDEPVQAIFAGHLHPELPRGHFGIAKDVANAAADAYSILLEGKGGHAAHPHQCRDPIMAGVHLINQMQILLTRELSPVENAVFSICRFQAGSAPNIIPEKALLEGTLRTFSKEVRAMILSRFRTMVETLQASHRIKGTLEILEGYPVLVNNPALVRYASNLAVGLLGGDYVHTDSPRMGAEDFAFFCERWPGVMIGVGCHDPQLGFQHGLHSPHFDFDEKALPIATWLFSELLAGYPEKNP